MNVDRTNSASRPMTRRVFAAAASGAVVGLATLATAPHRHAVAGLLDRLAPVGGSSDAAGADEARDTLMPLPASRYVAASDGIGGAHVFRVEDGVILPVATLDGSTSVVPGSSGNVCYLLRLSDDGSMLVSVIDRDGEHAVADDMLFPRSFTVDDSLLLYFASTSDDLRATLVSIPDGEVVFSESKVRDAMLSPYGKKLFYAYSDWGTLCVRDVATGAEVDVDEGVSVILLGSDDGRCLYGKEEVTGSAEGGAEEEWPAFLKLCCYDGAATKEIVFNEEPFGSREEYEGYLSAIIENGNVHANAASDEILVSVGDLLLGNRQSFVYVLGEDAPRALPGSWAGDLDHTERYTTFLDPRLIDDEFSQAVFRDYIIGLIGLSDFETTFDSSVWASWTSDNQMMFYVLDGNVYLHRMWSDEPDALLRGEGDAMTVLAVDDGSPNPFAVLADGTFVHLVDGRAVEIAREGDQFQAALWVPSLGKLAIVEKNGSLDLVDPADDSVTRLDKMVEYSELVEDILVYRDQDGHLFAVQPDGTPVEI